MIRKLLRGATIATLFGFCLVSAANAVMASEPPTALGQAIRNRLGIVPRIAAWLPEVIAAINEVLKKDEKTANTLLTGGDIRNKDGRERREFSVQGNGLTRAQMKEIAAIIREQDRQRDKDREQYIMYDGEEISDSDVSWTMECSQGAQVIGNQGAVSVNITNSTVSCSKP